MHVAPICQTEDIFTPWMDARHNRLPGLSPIPLADWLIQDDAFAAQMAYRDSLIDSQAKTVHICKPEATQSAQELLAILHKELPAGYARSNAHITRPDGRSIDTLSKPPLMVAGQLVQEDFALLQKQGNSHMLTGGIICFPAHWSLAQKIGRTLYNLHAPVDAYTSRIGAVMERIFANLQPEMPLERANFLIYTNPDLHQPMQESQTIERSPGGPRYVRCERQSLRRLPETGAIIFSIHTYLYPARALEAKAYEALAACRPELTED